MANCKCCGRDFNNDGFPFRPSPLSPLEYVCSIRCKNEMTEYYSPGKLVKQATQREESKKAWSTRNTHASDGTEFTAEERKTIKSLNAWAVLAIIACIIAALAGA